MKEYCIYIQNGSAMPYIHSIYKSLSEAKNSLFIIIDYEKERRKTFYVDNDFYENDMPLLIDTKYFCIKERDVSEWKKYTEEEILKNNNVRYFSNYKKSC